MYLFPKVLEKKTCLANIDFFPNYMWIYFNVFSVCNKKAVLTAKPNNYWGWEFLSQNTPR